MARAGALITNMLQEKLPDLTLTTKLSLVLRFNLANYVYRHILFKKGSTNILCLKREKSLNHTAKSDLFDMKSSIVPLVLNFNPKIVFKMKVFNV